MFTDLQAENDVVEPLIEGMLALAQDGQQTAREWVLTNAGAALSSRTPDGSFGRFFDGPPPTTTVTAWQTNGGLAAEIAASAIAPRTTVRATHDWEGVTPIRDQISGIPATIRFHGSGITLLGTLGAAVLRGRSCTGAHRRQRDVRPHGHLAEQIQRRTEHPEHDPVRLALAHVRQPQPHLATWDR